MSTKSLENRQLDSKPLANSGLKRNGEIDLLRIVFSVMIILFHFGNTYKYSIFRNGYIAVEFFFVVSGYLMTRHVWLKNTTVRDFGAVADETWHYLLKRTKGFYAYYVSAILLQVIVRFIIVNHSGVAEIGFGFLKSIPTFTLTFMGFNETKGFYVGSSWYLSSMLISAFLLYPLLLRHFKFSTGIIFPCFAFFILGYLVATNKTISEWEGWSGLVYFGVLRAVAEMALGGCIFRLSTNISKKKLKLPYLNKPLIKLAVTCFKVFCYAVVLVFARGSLMGEDFNADFNIHALLFCALGILLSFSNIGYCVPDSKVTRYLGKISLPLFVYHGLIRSVVKDSLQPPISAGLYVALVIMSIVVSIALMYITDFAVSALKKAFARIKA